MLLLDVGLFAALALADKAYDWGLIDLAWWAWLLLASPALILMALLLVLPVAELSPGRLRSGSIALLGLLVAADIFAVAVVLVALTSSEASQISGGDLLAHGMVVWLSNIITFALLFWESTRAARACAPSAGGATPTSSSRRTRAGTRAGTHG